MVIGMTPKSRPAPPAEPEMTTPSVLSLRSRLRDLSLRYKIPLRAMVLVLLTATVMTTSLLYREYGQMRRDVLDSAARWSAVLGQTLMAPMRHDDVWRAYEIVRAAAGTPDSREQISAITLVDAQAKVFVSTDPARYPVLAPLHEQGEAARELADRLKQDDFSSGVLELGSGRLYVVSAIEADGVRLGHLLIEYSTSIFAARFTGMWFSATLVTLLVLALILPMSAYWGSRLADPLLELARCMGKIGSSVPQLSDCRLHASKDELGQLSGALARLLVELREKQELEQQVVFSERLAAVGRLAGGIAHEINNPLGGMLNAINTYQRHGVGDPALTEKTLSLLERGLLQIKETVSALLVEAKAPGHPLGMHDLDDVHTLVHPDAEEKAVHLDWHCNLALPDAAPGNQVQAELRLPATMVRQVLINLLLNALDAVDRGGRVGCTIRRRSDCLELEVENDGEHIAPDRVPYLFEPYVTRGSGGHGLGLWITYQIVRELEGEINVQSDFGRTVFTVRLPLPPAFPSGVPQ